MGDQLNSGHSWFKTVDPHVTYLMMEIREETDYTRHHIQKIIAFFLAMRQFAQELMEQGHRLIYFEIDDPENEQTVQGNLMKILHREPYDQFEYLLPDEYRVDQKLQKLARNLDVPSRTADTEHFLTTRSEVSDFFRGKKQMLMETFYRHMRRKHDILMNGQSPLGGQWNYDADNQKKIPAKQVPMEPLLFTRNVRSVLDQVYRAGVKTIGSVNENEFIWPISRGESMDLLNYFLENALRHFGRYQDAMTPESWSIYHSRLSFALNVKLLHPMEVIHAAVNHWHQHQKTISLAQVEGFVRQILGWREFMRGVYWANMPAYESLNFFNHKKNLPEWYWTGETRLHCLSHAIRQSLQYAYAHHIQRLMVTGNFALLAGIDPDQLDEWYLGIYIDAIQWAEITNTRGMSQFADGGMVATKPYVSSANYIDKMGHYCQSCHYDPKKKTGRGACPFNSLYWHFHDRHKKKLEKNPRIGMTYRTWDRMDKDKKDALIQQAEHYLSHINSL